ncbi:MAG TPA: hypothetical protein VFJ85_06380 [Acidimicrobiales bacterium]|nr:hypothetical protein [Acidimicrobiales bacterium]
MSQHTKKRTTVFAFGVGAAVLALASTAFACTTFLGYITVSGNGTGNTAATAWGEGNGMFMDDPNTAGCQDLVASGTAFPTTGVRVNATSPTLDVTVGPEGSSGAGVGNCAGQLPAATYKVGVKAGALIAGGGGTNKHNCHSAGTPIDLTTSFSVNSSGNGAATGLASGSWTNLTSGSVWSVCVYSNNSAAAALNFQVA